ncbi:hypothetical protein ACFLUJ_07715 [Chloroflexota bacterium]
MEPSNFWGYNRSVTTPTQAIQGAEPETRLKASQDVVISIPKLESFVVTMRERLSILDFEGKRLVLDMLGVTAWIDGENEEVTGNY